MIRLKCFHGTSYENAQSIPNDQHFRKSDNEQLRMGVGAYFFCQAGDDTEYAIEKFQMLVPVTVKTNAGACHRKKSINCNKPVDKEWLTGLI